MKNIRIVNKKRFMLFIISSLSILFLTVAFFFFHIKSYGIKEENKNYYYIVQNGDTLWSIAEEHKEKNDDIREYIADIKDSNIIYNSHISQGDQLILPMKN